MQVNLVFLPWEKELYCRLLKLPMRNYAIDIALYRYAVDFETGETINDFRSQLVGVSLHPDERGNQPVHTERETRPEDSIISPSILAQTWNGLVARLRNVEVRAAEEEIDFLKNHYRDLYNRAVATKLPIFESFEQAKEALD